MLVRSSRRPATQTGYDEFLGILKRFRTLSVTSLAGGAAVPFVAYVAAVAPPWPPGIMLLTALTELLSLVIAFQFLHRKTRRIANRAIACGGIVTFATSFLYLILFSVFTFVTPKTGERWVKGFVCNPVISKAYADECPLLGLGRLQEAQYNSETLWQDWSIELMSELDPGNETGS
jgi:hypothetical protein